MNELRKFIAGAVCPACKQVDKLFVSSSEEEVACECVACGFRDVRRRNAEPGSAEFAKGLGEPAAEPGVVRIIEP